MAVASKKILGLPVITDSGVVSTDAAPIVASGVTSKMTLISWALAIGRLLLPADVVVSFINWLTNNRIYNVKDFGAVGDGIANDSAAVTAAFNAAGAKIAYFPNGTYKLSTWTAYVPTTAKYILGESRDGVKIVGASGVKFFVLGQYGAEVKKLWLDTWDHGISVDMTNDIPFLTASEVRFSSITTSAIGIPVGAGAAQVINNVLIQHCYLRIAGRFVALNGAKVKYAKIDHNDVETITDSFAVIIGNDSYSSNEKMIVTHNRFVDIGKNTVSGEAHAVLLYGFDAWVDDNHVENVWNAATSHTGAEGIYTKVVRVRIRGNTLINAVGGDGTTHTGGGQGAIASKGADIGEGTPNGYQSIVSGNHIETSTNFTTKLSSGDGVWGIYAFASNTLVSNNVIVNVPGGIRIAGHRNVAVRGNTIYNATGQYAIDYENINTSAFDIDISDNMIDGYGNLADNTAVGINLRAASATVQNARVNRNTIMGARAGATTRRAIIIWATVAMDQVDVIENIIYDTNDAVAYTTTSAITNVIMALNHFVSYVSANPVPGWTTVTGRRAYGNVGFITENNGTATVANGTTSIAVTHGITATPATLGLDDIQVTPTNNLGVATKFWISTVTSTQFTINVDVNPGAGTATFAWSVSVE